METGNYNPFFINFNDDEDDDKKDDELKILAVSWENDENKDNLEGKNEDDDNRSFSLPLTKIEQNFDEKEIDENTNNNEEYSDEQEIIDDMTSEIINSISPIETDVPSIDAIIPIRKLDEYNSDKSDDVKINEMIDDVIEKKNEIDNKKLENKEIDFNDNKNDEINKKIKDIEINSNDNNKNEEVNLNNNDKEKKIDVDLGPIKEAVYLVEVEKIKPNSQQPRKYFHPEALQELANSIREYGILQPLIVVRVEKETDFGRVVEYELIAGERRWRAAQLLGLERVPVIVRPNLEEKQKLEAAIIENVQRQDLNSIETARAYAKLADEFGLPQREIAQRIGISREAVSNAVRLLQLPSEAQRALSERKISESHARVILTLSNPEKQRALLGEILSKQLTVREAEIMARQAIANFSLVNQNPLEKIGGFIKNSAENRAVESSIKGRLEDILGTKVEVKKKGDRGKITINFFSEDELLEILKKIVGEKEG